MLTLSFEFSLSWESLAVLRGVNKAVSVLWLRYEGGTGTGSHRWADYTFRSPHHDRIGKATGEPFM